MSRLKGVFWTAIVMALLLGNAWGAHTDKVTVRAGGSVVVAISAGKIDDKSGSVKGALRVVETEADQKKTFTLIYLAPRVDAEFIEAVKYADGNGGEHAAFITVTPARDVPTLTNDSIYEQSFKALFVLLIIATILESGLAVVFNWRPFVLLFDQRGMKTLVSILFAIVFVNLFDLDLVTRLINIYTGSTRPVTATGLFVTALVIAGGSSGVNRLLVAFNFRSVKTAEQIAPKPPPTQAWVAVKLVVNAHSAR